jgi:hypothetical protein
MSKFSAKDSKVGERYLNLVSKDLQEGNIMKFLDGKSTKIKQTDDVNALIKAIKTAKQPQIDKLLKDGTNYRPMFISDNAQSAHSWSQIDKSKYTGMGATKTSDAKSTRMQELASMYAIEQGLNKNGYNSKVNFLSDCKAELLKIYPDMDTEWQDGFFEQQKTVADKVPNNPNFDFIREDGFMHDITTLVHDLGISKKDTWNPADIWLVSNPQKQMKDLESSVNVFELNAKLRGLFKDNKVVGISLKKMSGKEAKWELVNIKEPDLITQSRFYLGDTRSYMDGSSTGTIIKITDDNKNEVAEFQCRQNSSGISNLKIEAKVSSDKARLGKVPLDLLAKTMQAYGKTLNNAHQRYPKTLDEFMKQENTWQTLFNKVNPHIKTNIRNSQFVDSMASFYTSNISNAVAKLMQLDLLSKIISLQGKKKDEFVTDLYFLAQKKGKGFGPFGKLY